MILTCKPACQKRAQQRTGKLGWKVEAELQIIQFILLGKDRQELADQYGHGAGHQKER